MKNVITACLGSLVLMGCAAISTPEPTPLPTLPPKAIFVERPIVPPDVPMLDQDGAPVHLSDLRGKLVFVTFSNILCSEACVDALPVFVQVKRRLGEPADVVFLMVGTDSKADSPAALKAYLATFDPAFMGFTADAPAMRELAVRFGIHTFLRDDGALAPHAPFTYLLDKQGRLVYFFQSGLTAEQMADAALRVLSG